MSDHQVWATNKYGDREAIGRLYPTGRGSWTANAYGSPYLPTFPTHKEARRYILDQAELYERRYMTAVH